MDTVGVAAMLLQSVGSDPTAMPPNQCYHQQAAKAELGVLNISVPAVPRQTSMIGIAAVPRTPATPAFPTSPVANGSGPISMSALHMSGLADAGLTSMLNCLPFAHPSTYNSSLPETGQTAGMDPNYNRKDKSLGLLCQKYVPDWVLGLNAGLLTYFCFLVALSFAPAF